MSASRRRRRRRWLAVAAGVLMLLAAGAAVAWFLWLPQYRPALQPGERYGIDVSHFQGAIEWRRVAAEGIEFAYIKATEGGDLVDERFAENWQGADDAGLLRGAYHFFTLCTPGSEQAANFLRTVPSDAAALAPALDLELEANCSARPTPAAVDAEIEGFLQAVESATGRDVVLYAGDDFDALYPLAEDLDRSRWVLSWLRRPAATDWSIWQVGGFASVDGIEGDVDLDVMRAAT